MSFIFDTFKGLERETNKDRIEILERNHYSLFLVFDGVSGSKNAVSAIECYLDFILKHETKYLTSQNLRLSELFFEANRYLVEQHIEDGYATLAAVLLDNSSKQDDKFVSLGDTRIYYIDNQSLDQITIDDNPLNTPSVVTRYIGMIEYSYDDFIANKIPFFSRLMICTDGFYKILNDELIAFHKILNFKKLGSIKKSLAKKVFNNNTDDATYLVIEKHVSNRT